MKWFCFAMCLAHFVQAIGIQYFGWEVDLRRAGWQAATALSMIWLVVGYLKS